MPEVVLRDVQLLQCFGSRCASALADEATVHEATVPSASSALRQPASRAEATSVGSSMPPVEVHDPGWGRARSRCGGSRAVDRGREQAK